jgi:shikimate dehydrogenase
MEFELWTGFPYNHRVPEMIETPVSASTRYCAVLGHPIRHSASPAMQNAGLAALGLDWRYLAFDVHPDNLRAAISGAKVMKFIGLNLTVPHKLFAVSMVDVLDESAKAWGAVNTIRFEARDAHGHWLSVARVTEESHGAWRTVGFNTDADAIALALQEDLGFRTAGAKVLLLGAGGAGHTAALKLAAEGAAELFLVNRTQAKAEELVRDLQRRFPQVKAGVGYPDAGVDLVLNATTLGLKVDDPLPLDSSRYQLKRAGAVYDMIYRPVETALLRAARAAGCRTANGLGMLLHQGARALEIWSGQPAPVAAMRRALELNVYGI